MSDRAASAGTRKRHSLSTIESSVTRLLVSTKHLLESLTQWARHEADDKYVSDAYVKLGNDFRAATRAFNTAGVDVRDIGDVPQALREILEAALSEQPSQQNLDRFLPHIRSIIVTLLQNLKAKQQQAKQLASERTMEPEPAEITPTTTTTTNNASTNTATASSHSKSRSVSSQPPAAPTPSPPVAQPSPQPASFRHSRKVTSESMEMIRERTNSGSFVQPPSRRASEASAPSPVQSVASPVQSTPTPPQPPIVNSEALAQLQKGNTMQRRASKRFSAYQMARLTQDSVKHASFIDADDPPVPQVSPQYVSTPRFVASQLSPVTAEEESPSITAAANTTTPSIPVSHKAPPTRTVSAPVTTPAPTKDDPTPDTSIPAPTGTQSKRASGVYDPDSFLFLRIHNRTKKVPVQFPVSFASLRLLFVEKFAYSPGTESFPEVYLSDPTTGVTYELEESMIDEIKPGSLLMLNEVDPNTSLIKDLLLKVSTLNSRVDGMGRDISRQVKEAVMSMEISSPSPVVTNKGTPTPASDAAYRELGQLQFELKALKSAETKHKQTIQSLVESVQSQLVQFRELGLEDSSGKSSNRHYMEQCHQKLSEESDTLLTRVDDLQDTMEALRKDVAQRGVRVSEKQLKHTFHEIDEVKSSLSQMMNYISKEKSVWKKIWEQELDKVCEEQQFFNLQDDLTQDLEEDIRKIEETFDLIEQCSTQQMKAPKRNKPAFVVPLPEPGESMQQVKNAVLDQVSMLVPNHDSRVEAISKAEKMRQREREIHAQDQFQEELGDFVEEKKFKSSGGFEEIERIRQQKNEENLRNGMGVI
ncbi:hypothetical protein DIURU_004298 [Diutina rugosa]|uniref:Actin interacting protein 3 C-terminal domain-containing protein n=1 Tax=Diutina rugosa TaxID=5481 RepID=A0A642UHZ9_DIURU|nr:uncharacterized protein DIURU_004298 [Diutina rugosa]KAA8899456.1 hypothetical protein DIURU_004298 [Diutina rugosa]